MGLFVHIAYYRTCSSYRFKVHSITTAHVAEIKQKIKDLRKLEKVLTKMANECSQGDLPECPIIEILFSGAPLDAH